MPKKVHTKMHFGKWHDIEVEDDVTAYLRYANGATGVFITTTGEAPGVNRLEISGTKGKLLCDGETLKWYKNSVDSQEFSKGATGGFDVMKCETIDVETDGKNPQHNGVLNAFAANILRGEPLVANGEEGIRGLSLSNAMHLSSFLGHPVELPVDEDVYYEELMKRVATSRRKDNVKAVVADTSGSYAGAK